MQKSFLFFVVLFLSACASTDLRFEKLSPIPGQGVLYVYRLNQLTAHFMKAQVEVADHEKTLENGEYVAWQLPQGEYELSSQCVDSNDKNTCPGQIKFQVVAGESHFVRFNPRGGNDIGSSLGKAVGTVTASSSSTDKEGYLQYISRDKGLREIQPLKPSADSMDSI